MVELMFPGCPVLCCPWEVGGVQLSTAGSAVGRVFFFYLSPPGGFQPPQGHLSPSPGTAGRHGERQAQLLAFIPAIPTTPSILTIPSIPTIPTVPTILCAKGDSDLCSPLLTDIPGLALGRPRPLCPAAELHEHFCQLVWLYAADPLADEARPCPL